MPDVPNEQAIRDNWIGGYTCPSGYVPLALVANQTFTSGQFQYWSDVQIHGDHVALTYSVLPPNMVSFTTSEDNVSANRTPIKIPPGCRLLVHNVSGAPVNALVVVWPAKPSVRMEP